jgi:hypothetical protein
LLSLILLLLLLLFSLILIPFFSHTHIQGVGLGRTRAPAWSYLANSGLTGSSSSGSDIAEEQPPVAPAPVTSGASEQLLLHRDWFPEALAVDSKKEAQAARRERLKRQVLYYMCEVVSVRLY